SDVDLIVIADWKEDFLERIKILLELNKFKIPLEPLGYTEEEFEKLIKEGNSFILKVLNEGKIIYQAK
ncbi:MAG: nucleotidyltransferase domain-containing protein, partial [Nitrososphaerota archaeon]